MDKHYLRACYRIITTSNIVLKSETYKKLQQDSHLMRTYLLDLEQLRSEGLARTAARLKSSKNMLVSSDAAELIRWRNQGGISQKEQEDSKETLKQMKEMSMAERKKFQTALASMVKQMRDDVYNLEEMDLEYNLNEAFQQKRRELDKLAEWSNENLAPLMNNLAAELDKVDCSLKQITDKNFFDNVISLLPTYDKVSALAFGKINTLPKTAGSPATSGTAGQRTESGDRPTKDTGTGGGGSPATDVGTGGNGSPTTDVGTGDGGSPATDVGTGSGGSPATDAGTGGGGSPTTDVETGGGKNPTVNAGSSAAAGGLYVNAATQATGQMAVRAGTGTGTAGLSTLAPESAALLLAYDAALSSLKLLSENTKAAQLVEEGLELREKKEKLRLLLDEALAKYNRCMSQLEELSELINMADAVHQYLDEVRPYVASLNDVTIRLADTISNAEEKGAYIKALEGLEWLLDSQELNWR